MKGIIAKWIQHSLGFVIDMEPENFALKTANGYLLAQILHYYQIIGKEQMKMIKNEDAINVCNQNLELLGTWLSKINLSLDSDDILEIKNGVGTTSLHLFYRVFLEVQGKTTLDFVSEDVVKQQIGGQVGRFQVTKVKSSLSKPPFLDLQSSELCEPLVENGDIVHWYKDRMDNLQAKCEEAKEEYMHSRKKQIRCSLCNQDHDTEMHRFFIKSNPEVRIVQQLDADPDLIPNEEIASVNEEPYETLVAKQNEVHVMPPFVPDPQEAKLIMQKLKVKQKATQENRILKNELHRDLMREFMSKIQKDQSDSKEKHLTQIFELQSEYEKKLVSKLGQVKLQKELMIENKILQDQTLNKLKENRIIDALIVKGKDLDEKSMAYYCEKERLLHLHRQLWDERKSQEKNQTKETITKILKDITNCAIKVAEYKKRYGQEPSRREMYDLKNIFLTGEPIFDIATPVIQVIKDDSELEEITRETKRQNLIDVEDFECYMNFEYPWELSLVEHSPEMLQDVSFALNVMGYIVHKIYLAKYPTPPAPEVPSFPNCDIRVCINGLNDLNCLPTLQKMLSEKEIYVVDLQQVIDFCVNSYQIESKREIEEDESEIQHEKKKKPKPTKKEPKKGTKSKLKKGKKSEEDNGDELLKDQPVEFASKIVQTPIYFPEQEIPFTASASLGKTALEMLASGQILTDFLLVAMFIEYLKNLPNLRGWVLVNFPTTLDQAATLEDSFTGQNFLNSTTKGPVVDSIYTMKSDETLDLGLDDEISSFVRENLCKSRLLPDPLNHMQDHKIMDTILTAYIKIKTFDPEEKVGDQSLPPVLQELENPNMDPLDRLYSDLGVNYSLYHKELDFPTIKYLGKLIIGDYSIPLKSSIELFGDAIRNLDDNIENKTIRSAKMGEKAPKKIKGPHPSDIPSKKGNDVDEGSRKTGTQKKEKKGKVKVVIVHEDKATQLPEVEETPPESLDALSIEETPSPGKEGWVYSTAHPPEELQIALATLWEDVEEVYVEDLKQICFMLRLQLDTLMPFSQYIKDNMTIFLKKPDQKAEFLAKFQKAFNAFDMDVRKDDEFKCEMYCRIEDFKEQLTEIADKKMLELEDERCNLISKNWAPIQICELLNNYVNMFQIESDRFCDTITLADDYFLGIFTGKPCSSESPTEEAFHKYKIIDPNILNPMLKSVDSALDLTFFEAELLKMVISAMSVVKRWQTVSHDNIEKAKIVKPASGKKIQKPKKASKDPAHIVSMLDNETTQKIIDEWECILRGEVARVSLRFDLIKAHALRTIQEFVTVVQKTFQSVFKDIKEKYQAEMESIKNVTKVLQAALENETTLNNELIFVGDNFYINPAVVLIEPPLPVSELDDDLIIEGAFTVTQLSRLTDIFLDLSPKGFVPWASFEHLIQDIIWNNPEDGAGRSGPILWEKLDTIGLKKLIEKLFDNIEYVYWKDFIVYNLRVPFPTERELLLVRQEFRNCDTDDTELVTDYQFHSIKLWFELSYPQENAKLIQGIKNLLLKLYRVENGSVNYTALLLDFCKDDVLLVGFAKALELALGRQVCWDSTIGAKFVKEYQSHQRIHEDTVKTRDEERAETYNAAYEFVEGLVDHVVHIHEDVIIEDVLEPMQSAISVEKTDKNEKSTTSIKRVEIMDDDKAGLLPDEQVDAENDLLDGQKSDQELDSTLPSKVGFEVTDHTQMAFFLPVDVLISVLASSIPWHCCAKNPEERSFWEQAASIHQSYENPEFSNSVLAHEFLNSEEFMTLLRKTKKFLVKDPLRILKEMLNI